MTVAGSEPFDGRAEAELWLRSVSGDAAGRAGEVRSAITLVNRALGALRAAAGDPLVQDVGGTRALSIRIGFGEGKQLADGHWSEARQLPPPRRGRLEDVGPQSRVAAVLAERDEVAPGETLLLRARLDLESGRTREAALQLPAVLRGLALEASQSERHAERLAQVEQLLPGAEEAAAAALTGPLPDRLAELVREAIGVARKVNRAVVTDA